MDGNVRTMNALRRLVSALRTSGAAASHVNLSVAQQFALRMIGQRPGLTMGELAEATLTSRSAISEVVSRLVSQGLVRREADAGDHRRILVHLTPDGEALQELVGHTIPERLVAALAALDPGTQETLADALEAWVSFAGLSQLPPSMFGEPAPRPSALAESP